MRGFVPALLTTGVILENGGTDAPNSVSTCVASGVLSPRRASALAAGCNFFGALVSGLFFPAVARTVEELGGQKFMCILALSQSFAAGNPSKAELSPQTVLWCAFVLAAGTALCGRKMLGIASSLGIETRTEGLAADAGGAAVLIFATAFGLPVSTTHVKTASAAGAGSGGQGTFARLAAAWLLTFPVCGLLGYALVPLAKALLF